MNLLSDQELFRPDGTPKFFALHSFITYGKKRTHTVKLKVVIGGERILGRSTTIKCKEDIIPAYQHLVATYCEIFHLNDFDKQELLDASEVFYKAYEHKMPY